MTLVGFKSKQINTELKPFWFTFLIIFVNKNKHKVHLIAKLEFVKKMFKYRSRQQIMTKRISFSGCQFLEKKEVL